MRDFIPVIEGHTNKPRVETPVTNDYALASTHRWRNVEFRDDGNGRILASARQELGTKPLESYDSGSSSRGRGITSFDEEDNITLTEATYYYNGGSTSITGGNDFFDDYLGSFVRHMISGAINLVVVNAGNTSTDVGATHGNMYYTPDSTTGLTRVTDAAMPGNNGVSITRGGASLGGYFFLADIAGKIYNSDLNDLTAWNALDFITAEQYNDVGTYLGSHHDHIVYFGTEGIEFFYIVDNPPTVGGGSVLARRRDVQHSIGCIYPNTVVEQGDIIYFVGVDVAGNSGVFKLANFQLAKISSTLVDSVLFDNISWPTSWSCRTDIVMAFYRTEKSQGALILTVRSDTSFMYNLGLGTWVLMSLDNDLTYGGLYADTTDIFPIVSSNSPVNTRVQLTNSAVTVINSSKSTETIQDFGLTNSARAYVFTMPWDGGTTQKKRINWIGWKGYPAGDSGVTVTAPTITIAWEDYDIESSGGVTYGDFTNGRTIDVGVASSGKLYRCGTCHQRVFKIQFNDTGIAAVEGLMIDFDIVGQ